MIKINVQASIKVVNKWIYRYLPSSVYKYSMWTLATTSIQATHLNRTIVEEWFAKQLAASLHNVCLYPVESIQNKLKSDSYLLPVLLCASCKFKNCGRVKVKLQLIFTEWDMEDRLNWMNFKCFKLLWFQLFPVLQLLKWFTITCFTSMLRELWIKVLLIICE